MNSSPAPVEFNSEDTNRWRSRQEDPFAAQNRLAAAEKAATEAKKAAARSRSKRRTIVLIIAAAVLAVTTISLVTIIIIVNNIPGPVATIPTFEIIEDPDDPATIDVGDYFAQLQQIYYASDNIGDVEHAVQDALDSPAGAMQADQIQLANSTFFFWLGDCQKTLDATASIDATNLGIAQQVDYYDNLYYCYTVLGDTDKAAVYQEKYIDASLKASELSPGASGGGGAGA